MNYASKLRPGLLVALKTNIKGNASSSRLLLEQTANKTVAETTRLVDDPEEMALAIQTRGRVRSLIRSACIQSNFGFLCLQENRDKLDAAIAEARDTVNKFNTKASLTDVSFSVMVGEVASTDLEAVRGINSEVRDLLDGMRQGVTAQDAKAVRDLATRAKGIASMLQAEAASVLDEAVKAARKAATVITRAQADKTTVDLDTEVLTLLESKRTSFLDLDEAPIAMPVPAKAGNHTTLDLGGDRVL